MKAESATIQQFSACDQNESQKPSVEERSWQGSGIEGLLPIDGANPGTQDSRQPSPAPRLNDISATSTSTELDADGQSSLESGRVWRD